MPFIFPPDQRFDCTSCARCCRASWNVLVDPEACQRIDGSPLCQEVERELGQSPLMTAELKNGTTATYLRRHPDGQCVFLDANNKCRIHSDLGERAKPYACRTFPFVVRATPEGVVVGVSYFCTAIQRNEGRLLSEHPDIEPTLGTGHHLTLGRLSIPLYERITVSWKSYTVLEEVALACLAGPDLARGLWNVLLGTGLTVLCILENPPPPRRLTSILVPTISDEDLDQRLRAMPALLVVPDSAFESMERIFVVGALGAIESNAESCEANADAIGRRGIVDSATLGRPIDLAGFDAYRAGLDTAWSLPHFQRYLHHLVWRKFLVGSNHLLANACALYLALPLLSWYRDLGAFANGRPEPVMEDVYFAFRVLERSFVTHSRAMAPLLKEMAGVVMGQLQELASNRVSFPSSEPSA